MKVSPRHRFAVASTIAALCLAGAAVGAQAPDRVVLSEEAFKNIVLLRGVPVDTFFEAMGMFANAMGNDCTYCHAAGAALDKTAFATPTPRIQRARQMITMMNALNTQYFGGQPRVTCYTCHGGNPSPRSDPSLMVQYGTPVEDPNIRDFATDPRTSANQIFDRYIEAIGGAQRVAALASFAARGTYAGFDTAFDKVPVEIYGRAPGLQAMFVHLPSGVSARVFDGRNGWMAGPETPVPLVTLTGGNLDRARLEGMVAFPTSLRQAFPQWRVGRTAIDGNEVRVVQGLLEGQAVANLYFAENGLLVRLVRWTRTPVGFVPTQVDFEDYREVAGIKLPFKRTVTQTYMQIMIELADVQPDAPVDASRFARPAPVARPPA